MTTKKKEETQETKAEGRFTKSQILSSKKYNDKRDLVNVLLKDERQYSFSEVDTLIDNFMKGKVN